MMFWRVAFTFCFMILMGVSVSHAFGDIVETDPQYDVFTHLRDIGVMHGFSDGNFYPGKNVSRAEALTIALRTGGFKFGNYNGETYYSDVNPNAWYAPVVSQAYQMGFLSKKNATFRPDEAVNKAEFLTFLFKATKVPLEQYQNNREIALDIPNNEWFAPSFAYAKRFQIAHLPTDKLYRPAKSLTRREVGMMTHRTLRLIHGSESTSQVVELEGAIKQFLALLREERYTEAEAHIHTLNQISDKLVRTKANQDTIAARAISDSIEHLGDSFRAFRYGKNLKAISSLHLALKQAQRAEMKSEAMAPFANDLTILIHQILLSLTQPQLAQLD